MMYLLVRGEEISEVGARVPDGIYLAIMPEEQDFSSDSLPAFFRCAEEKR
jgi:hypothetical protein